MEREPFNREQSIVAQALAKSVIESTNRPEWIDAGRDALRLYRDLLAGLAASPGSTAPAPTASPSVSPSAPAASAPAPPPGADARSGGSLYTVVAVSRKNSSRNARLCLVDPGGAESWVGFRGGDAVIACQLQKGDDVTCYVERKGEWLNGSNLRRHYGEAAPATDAGW